MTDLYVTKVRAWWAGRVAKLDDAALNLEVQLSRNISAPEVERLLALMFELHQVPDRYINARAGDSSFVMEDIDPERIEYLVDNVEGLLPRVEQEGAVIDQENARIEDEVAQRVKDANLRLTQKRA